MTEPQQQIEQQLRARNESLEDQVRQRTGMIQMLHDIASHVHEAVSLDEAVNFVLRRVAEHIGWSFGHAFRVPTTTPDRLVPMLAHYEHSGGFFNEFRNVTRQTVLPAGEGLPGRALTSGEPVWAAKLPDDLRSERADVIDRLPIESAAAFPVSVGGRVELVLEFLGTHKIDDDVRIHQGMTTVAVHLARTIERLRAETQLRESEQRFRELAESVNQVFWILDPATDELQYVSPKWPQILGIEPSHETNAGKPWYSRLHPDDRDWVAEDFRISAREGLFDVVYRLIRADGGIRWVHDVAIPVQNESGNVGRIIGVAEDITERRALERGVADVATREQQRLSRDLHDSIGQELTGLAMMAARHVQALTENAPVQALTENAPAEAEVAASLADGLKRTLQQVRRISRGLAPVDIEAGGLIVALAQLAEQTSLAGMTDCVFQCDDPVSLKDPGTATHVYQITQEAVANAVKHANAEKIAVTLATGASGVELAIKDNGCGDLRMLERSANGMGLRIMRYRADLIGAKLTIESSPQQGTRIFCRIPRQERHSHVPQ